MRVTKTFAKIALLAGALALAACAGDPVPPPTPTKTPLELITAPPFTHTPAPLLVETSATVTEQPTVSEAEIGEEPDATPTSDITGTPDAAPTWTPPPTPESRVPTHYWLSRPFAEQYVTYVDRNYPYGNTSNGKYEVHHGYEFPNPKGTPILSPANATVAFAGEDLTEQFGPKTHFYGYLVVLDLNTVAPGTNQPVYVLFGHMDSIEVEQGEEVSAGDEIGKVGNSGVAIGAHLHLEVRVGDMRNYNGVQNPDLWLAPFNGYGTLAGKVVDGNGNFLQALTVTARDQTGFRRYTWTYTDNTVGSDAQLGENFTLGDLPKGYYLVYLSNPRTGKTVEELVYVEPGRTTWVEFVLE